MKENLELSWCSVSTAWVLVYYSGYYIVILVLESTLPGSRDMVLFFILSLLSATVLSTEWVLSKFSPTLLNK